MILPMRLISFGLLLAAAAFSQNRFDPALLQQPDVKRAIDSIAPRAPAIVEEWMRLVETPAPSGKEQSRARYIEAEMRKLGLAEIKTDDLLNVSGVRKGTGGGPSVVFAAHTDTVFPEGTDVKVRRDGKTLRAPGVGDDTANLMAVLEMFRALDRGGVKTKGDLIFLASTQEELGLLGAKHWLEASGYKPDTFIAVDLSAGEVWYGALRIDQYKFFYTSPGAHTMESRGGPSPARAVARAIEAMYAIPLPPVAEGLGGFKLPVINVGMLGGGTVVNAVPREAWFTVDLRSLDSGTQDRLATAVNAAARGAADTEKVGFRVEHKMGVDYSKARPHDTRLHDAVVQTAVAAATYFRKPGAPAVVPQDVGSTDANIAVAMGIPAAAVGAAEHSLPHRLEEYADSDSIVPGIKFLIALAVSLAGH
jgi:tripeptide aminopeptidase